MTPPERTSGEFAGNEAVFGFVWVFLTNDAVVCAVFDIAGTEKPAVPLDEGATEEDDEMGKAGRPFSSRGTGSCTSPHVISGDWSTLLGLTLGVETNE